ncbi:MAG: ABC transporter ATP-binding protein [Lachnospiraceae bacterium]|nr:ABC transporter ATP-binding protein [Lachnospiraceae bacterium]
MAEEKTVIRVKNLYKIFSLGKEKVKALNGVDLEIKKGEFVAICGTSGSGKSTLLNMLSGLEKPTKGEIVVAGTHIEHMSENELVRFRREHVGFIFQAYNLIKSMDAVENVALPLIFRGVRREKRNRMAKEMLKALGVEKISGHMPSEMSGGQQQRVGIARALVIHPEIIFADEPTGNLDSATAKDVLELMQRIVHEEKQTLVMVTHDGYLASFADRIVRISDGRIVKSIKVENEKEWE